MIRSSINKPGVGAALLLILLMAMAGCNTPGVSLRPTTGAKSPTTTTSRPTSGSTPTVSKGDAPLPSPAVSGSSIAEPGILSVAGLTGKVKAPSSLIANNSAKIISDAGGAIISNNGSGIMANNSGGYRLLELAQQVPVVGARVSLVDAAGVAVNGVDGKPLITTTDALGIYAFPTGLPLQSLRIVVDLGESGQLQAIAAKGRAETTIDIDVVSTLTSGYILDQYVNGQTDRQATLDKLPAAEETRTRDLALSTLAAGNVAIPTSLASSEIVKTVNTLRAQDPRFDGQMEAVKRLLVAAGVSDLGNGRVATGVGLSNIDAVVRLESGDLFFSCRADNRVWRVDANGRLFTAVGRSRVTIDASIEGKQGADAAIGSPVTIVADRDGLLVLEAKRLSRRGADGRLTEVASGLLDAKGVWATENGRYHIIENGVWGRASQLGAPVPLVRPAQILAVEAGKPATVVHSFSEGDSRLVRALARTGNVSPGVVALGVMEATTTQVTRNTSTGPQTSFKTVRRPKIFHLKLADFTLTQALDGDPALYATLTMDAHGTPIFQRKGKKELEIGTAGDVQIPLPANIGLFFNFRAAARPGDTSLLLPDNGQLFRLEAGGKAPTVIAGVVEPLRSGRAEDIVLFDPEVLAADANGKLYVFDYENSWLWEIGADGNARVLFVVPDEFPGPDDPSVTILTMRVDAGNRLVLLDESDGDSDIRLLTLNDRGQLAPLFTADHKAKEVIRDFFPRPGGGHYVLLDKDDTKTGQYLLAIGADGARQQRSDLVSTKRFDHVAITPRGKVYLMASDGVWEWSASAGLTTTAAPKDWLVDAESEDSWLCVDAQGRLIGTDTTGIRRLDPVTGAVKDLVGYQGSSFKGTGVDDSVGDYLLTPSLDGAGNLYFLDPDNHQVKRVPAAELP